MGKEADYQVLTLASAANQEPTAIQAFKRAKSRISPQKVELTLFIASFATKN